MSVEQFLPPSDVTTTYYGKGGAETSQRDAFAKASVKPDGSGQYWVLFGRGDLFDPNGQFKYKARSSMFALKKVSKKVFDYYLGHLQSNQELLLTRARRTFMQEL